MKSIRNTIGALAVAATALAGLPGAVPSAAAGPLHCDGHGRCYKPHHRHLGDNYAYRYHGGKYYRHHGRHHGRHHYRKHRNNDAAAAAILGIAGLAIVGGVLAHQNRTLPHTADPNYRARNHYPPAPRSPNVITYESSLEPWTPAWFRWCDKRYRSFNPERGTFRGYDGRDHFCVPK